MCDMYIFFVHCTIIFINYYFLFNFLLVYTFHFLHLYNVYFIPFFHAIFNMYNFDSRMKEFKQKYGLVLHKKMTCL